MKNGRFAAAIKFPIMHPVRYIRANMTVSHRGRAVKAFLWVCLIGQYQNERKPIRVLAHKRRAQSIFRYGIDSLLPRSYLIISHLKYL